MYLNLTMCVACANGRRRKSQQNSRDMVGEEKTGGDDDKPPDQDKDKDADKPSHSRCIPSCTIL
jgi:hypothetical protein